MGMWLMLCKVGLFFVCIFLVGGGMRGGGMLGVCRKRCHLFTWVSLTLHELFCDPSFVMIMTPVSWLQLHVEYFMTVFMTSAFLLMFIDSSFVTCISRFHFHDSKNCDSHFETQMLVWFKTEEANFGTHLSSTKRPGSQWMFEAVMR